MLSAQTCHIVCVLFVVITGRLFNGPQFYHSFPSDMPPYLNIQETWLIINNMLGELRYIRLLQAAYLRACLYKSVARLRSSAAKFTIQDIDFTLCTYYIYGYAGVDSQGATIRSLDYNAEEGPGGQYSQFNDAKLVHFYARTILSVGGPGLSSDTAFQELAAHDIDFTAFSRNSVTFLRANKFDGLDIHWEYMPSNQQKDRLTKLLEALRQEFDKDVTGSQLLLTVTVIGMSHHADRAYDVPQFQRNVDYVFVMAYDLIFRNNTLAIFRAPLFYKNSPKLNPTLTVNYTIRHWHELGLSYDKLVLGVSALGHYVRLVNPLEYQPGSPATEDILRGPVYGMLSRLAFPEICMMMNSSKTNYDAVQMNAYLIRGREWVGYDDEYSIGEKVIFVETVKAAGIFFSALDEDDFSGTTATCQCSATPDAWLPSFHACPQTCNSGRYPLTSYIKALFEPIFESRTRRTTKRTYKTTTKEYTYFTTSTVETTVGAAQGGTEGTPIQESTMRDVYRTNNTLHYYLLTATLLIIFCGFVLIIVLALRKYCRRL